MKYIKLFEQIDEPQKGDYVKIDSNCALFTDLKEFFDNEVNWVYGGEIRLEDWEISANKYNL